jgi:membrane fusion protein (multidrug efflux system)
MADTDTGRLAALKSNRWLVRGVLAGLVVIVLAVVFLPKIIFSFSHESTDDAFVEGTIVPVSAEVSGTALRVLVSSHERVTAGQSLVEIAPDDYLSAVTEKEAALEQARAAVAEDEARIEQGEKDLAADRARLRSAEAQAALSGKDKDRYTDLLAQGAVSQSRVDEAVTTWKLGQAQAEAARAAVEAAQADLRSRRAALRVQRNATASAKAALETARRNLGRTTVHAPFAGTIAQRNVDPGKYVAVGQPLFSLVDADSVWVTANFKETQVHKIRVGMPATLDVDAYPGITFRGRVQSFEPATGAVLSLLPPQNATGNFIKITQRVPVRIAVEAGADPVHPLWPGLSVTVHVDVSAETAGAGHGG